MQGKPPQPLFIPRPDWFDDAACRGMGPGLFFPERTEGRESSVLGAAAKLVCARCVCREQCLDENDRLAYAISQHGVWGGLSPKQRRRSRREPAERAS